MLHRRTKARTEQRREDRPEAGCIPKTEKCDPDDQRTERKQIALAESLGEQPGGDLERCHGGTMRTANETDLHERQAEALCK